MSSARFVKLFILIAGAATTVSAAAVLLRAEAQQEAGSRPASSPQPGAQEVESSQDPGEPGGAELTLAELFGQEGQRVQVGNSVFMFNDIFDFSGTANDLFAWGWLPTISGNISDNALIGGQKVSLVADAVVGGDMFVMGQTILIDGRVDGDMYVMGNDLQVSEGASVGGGVHGGTALATFSGVVGGPVIFASGAVTINGTIRGDVTIDCGELELGPDAVIEGNLRYESAREATIDPAARVIGEIFHDVPQEDAEDSGNAPAASRGGWFSFWSLLWNGSWMLSSFIIGALLLAIGGDAARRPTARLTEQPALGLGFGFVVAVVFPAAALLAMILVVTIPVGLIALVVYFAAVYLARLVVAQTVGAWLLRSARSGAEPSAYAALALGLVLYYVLMQIPYLGFLVWLATIVGGLGGIFLATRVRKEAVTPGPQPATAP